GQESLQPPTTEKTEMIKKQKFPPGWDEKRVKEVIAHYENQTEDEEHAEIEGDDARRMPGEQHDRIVAGRSDRQAHVAGLHVERLDEDVSVLPALGIAN